MNVASTGFSPRAGIVEQATPAVGMGHRVQASFGSPSAVFPIGSPSLPRLRPELRGFLQVAYGVRLRSVARSVLEPPLPLRLRPVRWCVSIDDPSRPRSVTGSRAAVEPLDTNGPSSSPFGVRRGFGPSVRKRSRPTVLSGIRGLVPPARRDGASQTTTFGPCERLTGCRAGSATPNSARSSVLPREPAGQDDVPASFGSRSSGYSNSRSDLGRSAGAGDTRLRPEVALAETSRQQRTAYRSRSQPSSSVRRRTQGVRRSRRFWGLGPGHTLKPGRSSREDASCRDLPPCEAARCRENPGVERFVATAWGEW
jgi:hypothetical protein